jgi:hypothetical protein
MVQGKYVPVEVFSLKVESLYAAKRENTGMGHCIPKQDSDLMGDVSRLLLSYQCR